VIIRPHEILSLRLVRYLANGAMYLHTRGSLYKAPVQIVRETINGEAFGSQDTLE